MNEFDYKQFKEYPSLEFLFTKLNSQKNLTGRRAASRFIHEYSFLLRRIGESNLASEIKRKFYAFIKDTFKKRLADIRSLDGDDLNNLNGYIMGRWRKYMGYEITKRKKEAADE